LGAEEGEAREVGFACHLGATHALLDREDALGIDLALELGLEGGSGRLQQLA
jgi:hypothetical protein